MSVITNAIPPTLNDLLVKLKILSMLETGKKINMSNFTFTDSSSWIGAINRGLKGEGKESLIIQLNQIVAQVIIAIDDYNDTEFCGIIVNHLANAKIGIQNLNVTYSMYPRTVAQLAICIENIDLQLRKNQKLLIGHNKD